MIFLFLVTALAMGLDEYSNVPSPERSCRKAQRWQAGRDSIAMIAPQEQGNDSRIASGAGELCGSRSPTRFCKNDPRCRFERTSTNPGILETP
jgi:hypothetical protein